jgi:NAD(P)-dependent dehydrogenase (short-subunit alcohol dehydrogenase family)
MAARKFLPPARSSGAAGPDHQHRLEAGTTPPGNSAYNVSKVGVKALTEALQHELCNTDGNKVSAHIPGHVFTGLT